MNQEKIESTSKPTSMTAALAQAEEDLAVASTAADPFGKTLSGAGTKASLLLID